MTKSSFLALFLQPSLFVIRPARYARKQISDRFTIPTTATAAFAPQSIPQGRRVFCGSFLKFLSNRKEIAARDSKASSLQNGTRFDGEYSIFILSSQSLPGK